MFDFIENFVAHVGVDDLGDILHTMLPIHRLELIQAFAALTHRVILTGDDEDALTKVNLGDFFLAPKDGHDLEEFLPEAIRVAHAAIRVIDVALDVFFIVGEPIQIGLPILDGFRVSADAKILEQFGRLVPVLFIDGNFGQETRNLHQAGLTTVRAAENDRVDGVRIEFQISLNHEGAHRVPHDRGRAIGLPQLLDAEIGGLHIVVERSDVPLLEILNLLDVEALPSGIENQNLNSEPIEILSKRLVPGGVFLHSFEDEEVGFWLTSLKESAFEFVAGRRCHRKDFHINLPCRCTHCSP